MARATPLETVESVDSFTNSRNAPPTATRTIVAPLIHTISTGSMWCFQST
jgi:hypothetical protein